MSSSSSQQQSDSRTAFEVDAIEDALEVTGNIANALVAAFSAWAELAAFIESDGSWTDLEGIAGARAREIEAVEDELYALAEEAAAPSASDDPDPGSESPEQSSSDDAGPDIGLTAMLRASDLGTFLDSFKRVADECRLHITEDGLQVRVVNPENVHLADTVLAAEAFESYEPIECVIGVNLERFADVIGSFSARDIVTLEVDPTSRELHIDNGKLSCSMRLIDPDSIRGEPDVPDLDLPNSFTVEYDDFRSAERAADNVSDHITVGARPDEEQVIFAAEGETDEVELELTPDDWVDADLTKEAESLYSMEYITAMRRMTPKQAEIEFTLGEEFPLFVEFDAIDGHLEAKYMLAPRIQT